MMDLDDDDDDDDDDDEATTREMTTLMVPAMVLVMGMRDGMHLVCHLHQMYSGVWTLKQEGGIPLQTSRKAC